MKPKTLFLLAGGVMALFAGYVMALDDVTVKIPWQPGTQFNFSTNIYWKADTAGETRTLTVEPKEPTVYKFKATPTHTETGITVTEGAQTDATAVYNLTIVSANKEGNITVTGALVPLVPLTPPPAGGSGGGGGERAAPETPFKVDEFLRKSAITFTIPLTGTNLLTCVGSTNNLEATVMIGDMNALSGIVSFSLNPTTLGEFTTTNATLTAGVGVTKYIATTNTTVSTGMIIATASNLTHTVGAQTFSLPPNFSVSTNLTVTVVKLEIDPVSRGTTITATSPLNTITNAAAIVIDPAHPGGSAGTATIVAITKFLPASLALTEHDPRVVWTIDDPSKAGFLGGQNKGRVVKVFGKPGGAGRVLLTASLTDDNGTVACENYEAQVVNEKTIPFRVNLLSAKKTVKKKNGKTKTVLVGTDVTVAKATEQIAIANIYLRQFGIRLVPDENTTIMNTNGVAKAIFLKKGFFDLTVTNANLVAFVTDPDAEKTIQFNDDDGVVQISYIQRQSDQSLGFTPSNPGNANGLQNILKYRNAVDDISRTWTNHLLGADLQVGKPSLWGIVVTDFNARPPGSPPLNAQQAAQQFGNTIAHEMGHVMCLKHRESSIIFGDGLPESVKNLMHATSLAPIAEDLDLIQLNGARGSEAIPH